jgi:hypothetical protein
MLQEGGDDTPNSTTRLRREVAADHTKRVAAVSDYANHQTRPQNELRARLFELNPHSPRPAADEELPSTHAGSSSEDTSSPPPTAHATELRFRGHNRCVAATWGGGRFHLNKITMLTSPR